jgi:DNA-binding NtrC family response regulator
MSHMRDILVYNPDPELLAADTNRLTIACDRLRILGYSDPADVRTVVGKEEIDAFIFFDQPNQLVRGYALAEEMTELATDAKIFVVTADLKSILAEQLEQSGRMQFFAEPATPSLLFSMACSGCAEHNCIRIPQVLHRSFLFAD